MLDIITPTQQQKENKMWKFKEFKTYLEQQRWIINNEHKYQIDVVFINNGYGVEYKALRQL